MCSLVHALKSAILVQPSQSAPTLPSFQSAILLTHILQCLSAHQAGARALSAVAVCSRCLRYEYLVIGVSTTTRLCYYHDIYGHAFAERTASSHTCFVSYHRRHRSGIGRHVVDCLCRFVTCVVRILRCLDTISRRFRAQNDCLCL